MSLVAATSVLGVFALGGSAGAMARGTTSVELGPATIEVVTGLEPSDPT